MGHFHTFFLIVFVYSVHEQLPKQCTTLCTVTSLLCAQCEYTALYCVRTLRVATRTLHVVARVPCRPNPTPCHDTRNSITKWGRVDSIATRVLQEVCRDRDFSVQIENVVKPIVRKKSLSRQNPFVECWALCRACWARAYRDTAHKPDSVVTPRPCRDTNCQTLSQH